MQRYFINNWNISEEKAVIDGPDFHHIKNVMRSKLNDKLVVCKDGTCFTAFIVSFESNSVTVKLEHKMVDHSKSHTITIAQGLIRRERFEYMLQKATELGADYIIPFVSKYCIIKVNEQKETAKIDRWNKITKEASEQSHRSTIATVLDIKHLLDIEFDNYDMILVAYEKENHSSNLKALLRDNTSKKNILIIIGPEGGLAKDEIEQLEKISNVNLVGLGKRILRSETASSYILSILDYEYEMII